MQYRQYNDVNTRKARYRVTLSALGCHNVAPQLFEYIAISLCYTIEVTPQLFGRFKRLRSISNSFNNLAESVAHLYSIVLLLLLLYINVF